VLQRLPGSHAYVLDDTGMLALPGLESVPLLGLTEEDIEQRLGAEPYLANFNIDVRILSTELIGKEALKPFGYDIFESNEATFDPPMSGPVPLDYRLGGGDVVNVQLFGNVNETYELVVGRDGTLQIPEVGPVPVAGLTFSEFREDINGRIGQVLIGTQASVTMGTIKTLRVFVLGDAKRPGSYVVEGTATISSALYRSGGINEIGSLRNIQVKRQGSTVATLDLYDLFMHGDTSGDLRLQTGDVIYVPPIGPTVGVGGAVIRPAIYEARGEVVTAADAIRFAGGLSPDAFPNGARLERFTETGERVVLSVDLRTDDGRNTPIKAGDILMVPEVLPDLEGSVSLSGHVQRPGPYEWRPGMRLTDIIREPGELKPGVDDNYVLVRRERVRGRPIEVLSADLGAALSNPGGPEDIPLEARDTVFVFSLSYGRQRVILPLLDELQLQASYDKPFQQVEIAGNVRAPGAYPLEPGMRISDLIRAGGRLTEDAYTLEAELSRYSVVNGEFRVTEIVDVNLDSILSGDVAADVVLSEHDHLNITRVPEWDSTWSVTLEGEIKFPGEYRIRRGENLAEVIDRAGGLTDEAFPEGAVFLRRALKQREQEQIDSLARRMESDLISLSLQTLDTTGAEALSTGQQLLTQLRGTEAVGRLVIDLERLASRVPSGRLSEVIELRDGDRLLVPKQSQEVTVIGETQLNTSHLYQEGLRRDEYIELSGGLTRRADEELIYVVRASGAVVSSSRTRWLGRSEGEDIRPGDTIVVPLETDKIRPLTFWGSVTQILYQGAIAIAAVRTFDNN
jgi:protein involved in polysaccharide export with SLBB domain